jgi:hypothetical protein
MGPRGTQSLLVAPYTGSWRPQQGRKYRGSFRLDAGAGHSLILLVLEKEKCPAAQSWAERGF